MKLQTGTLKGDQSLIYTIEAETFSGERKFSRVYFKSKSDQRGHVVIRRFTLEPGRLSYCQDETVYLKENTRDILSPIKVIFTNIFVSIAYVILFYLVPVKLHIRE